MEFLAIFLACYGGGAVAKKLKLPSGTLLGSLIVAGIIALYITPVSYPTEVKFMARVFSGVMIGLKISKEDLKMLSTVWKPLVFVIFGMLVNSTLLALLLSHFTAMDLTTALFACVPGGMADISLMAEDYGANMPQVALVQLLRLLSLMFVYPILANSLSQQEEKIPEKEINPKTPSKSQKTNSLPPISELEMAQAVRTFVFAGFGALLFEACSIPAGELLGAMAVTLVRKLHFSQGFFYPPTRTLVQVTVGIIIGSTITVESLITLVDMFDVTLFSVTCILLFGLFMGFLLHRFYGTDKVSSLLAVAPGGVQEMVLLADSLGGDVSFVTTLQVFRVMIVFSVFPLWISFLLSILS